MVRGQFFSDAIVRGGGNYPGGNNPGGNYPRAIFRGQFSTGEIVLEPEKIDLLISRPNVTLATLNR